MYGYDTGKERADVPRAPAAGVPLLMAGLCRLSWRADGHGRAVRGAADVRSVRRVCRADLRAGRRPRFPLYGRLSLRPSGLSHRRAGRQLDLYLPLYAAELHHRGLSADVRRHAGRVRRGQYADHPDQAAGKAPRRSGKGENARQPPARRLPRYPHAADGHRGRH